MNTRIKENVILALRPWKFEFWALARQGVSWGWGSKSTYAYDIVLCLETSNFKICIITQIKKSTELLGFTTQVSNALLSFLHIPQPRWSTHTFSHCPQSGPCFDTLRFCLAPLTWEGILLLSIFSYQAQFPPATSKKPPWTPSANNPNTSA